MPKGIAKSGLRMTRQRLAAFEMTAPELAAQYKKEQELRNPLYLVKQVAEKLTPKEYSDDDISKRLNSRFNALDIMTQATAHGVNRSLIISGPAGLGKSFGVEKVLSNLGGNYRVKQVSGFIRLTGLYKLFYENRHSNCTVVFDDSDSIFDDLDKLNMLKGATDSKGTRKLAWGAETRMETENGEALPREFVFEGNVIFITNTDMAAIIERGGRLAPHFEALVSRSHYLDLGMKTNRDYLIRIKEVCRTGMLRNQGIDTKQESVLLDYIEENQDTLRELSLRMVLKLATLMKMSPHDWESLAWVTCNRSE
jgi:hypothetical protein